MSDSIQLWLNAAGRIPLLPKEELIRLANKRDTLEPGSKAYIKIINRISEHNLRLIPGVVQKYLLKLGGGGNLSSTAAADLLQQGYLGLRRAAEKYDATRGFTFSTYAYNWIYQAIARWNNSVDRLVYIPENSMVEFLYRRRHGKPSKSKNGRIGADVLSATQRSLFVDSIDRPLDSGKDDGGTFADTLNEDNLIISKKPTEEGAAVLQLKDLMAECGIRPKVQDLVLAYAKRGRMSIVASKLQMSPKHCQNLYSKTVRTLKEHVEAKEAARKAAIAVRLSK